MIEHTLTLYGPDCANGRPHAGTVGPLLNLLGPVLRDNLRLAFFSSSRIKGRPYQALQKASEVRFIGIGTGDDESSQLRFEMPLLGDAAPKLYEQLKLWDNVPKREDTGFDLLGYTLSDIAANRVDSNRFDLPLLRRVNGFRKVLNQGVSRMVLGGHHLTQAQAPPPIAPPLFDKIGALANKTPPPRRVRVQGKLDMIRCSDRVFELILKDGARIRAVWTPSDLAPMPNYLNRNVLIEGDAMFRPSGSVFRLDVEAIRHSEGQDGYFSTMPLPMSDVAGSKQPPKPFGTRNGGFGAIAGAWPGEESIEQLLETLAELGH